MRERLASAAVLTLLLGALVASGIVFAANLAQLVREWLA